jgi:hypothetical protein
MNLEILERDIQAGTAKLRFSHNGVTHTSSYNLKMIVPGTERIFAEYGMEFDAAMQQKVIEKLTALVQREIEDGILHNPV